MAKALVLEINGENKKFYKKGSFKGRQARKGSRLAMLVSTYAKKTDGLTFEEVEKFDETIDQVEKMIVEDLYDNQFTVDELQDGVDGDKYFQVIMGEVSGSSEDTGKK
ncbi:MULTISPECIES: hypothetical protein [Staphylococcus]|uniref:Phage tail protein n=1 Tax=Staphylococcus agnetis TaxID=985762 RepID=A0AAW9YYV6_9STAP|nr:MULTISPECIES: hypothetical protein [Staphylococcus]NHM92480.1 hypothetical protein [Staphylococcus sp. 10602379]NJI03270.1 hypothetical protein [Staphylococcus agnetis]